MKRMLGRCAVLFVLTCSALHLTVSAQEPKPVAVTAPPVINLQQAQEDLAFALGVQATGQQRSRIAKRRYDLFHRIRRPETRCGTNHCARCRQALLLADVGRCLYQCFWLHRNARDGNQGWQILDRWPRLERQSASRNAGDPVTHKLGLDHRAHLG